MTKVLSASLLGFAFLVGMVGTLSVSHYIPHGPDLVMANVAMIAISLVAGLLLFRREPFKSFLGSRPVLWFLFLANLVGGVLALVLLDGSTSVLAGVGLLLASTSGLVGLIRRRRATVAAL